MKKLIIFTAFLLLFPLEPVKSKSLSGCGICPSGTTCCNESCCVASECTTNTCAKVTCLSVSQGTIHLPERTPFACSGSLVPTKNSAQGGNVWTCSSTGLNSPLPTNPFPTDESCTGANCENQTCLPLIEGTIPLPERVPFRCSGNLTVKNSIMGGNVRECRSEEPESKSPTPAKQK